MRVPLLAALLILACQRPETVLQEVTSQMRPKLRVQVMVKASAEEPTAEDLALRKTIEQQIEQQNIGRLVSSGAGSGFIDVTIEVENTADAIARLRSILLSLDVLPRSSFRVVELP